MLRALESLPRGPQGRSRLWRGRLLTWASCAAYLTAHIILDSQVATDLQRATPYGDVNCQRAMGILTSSYGLFSGLRSMRDFADSCWREQPERFEVVGSDGQARPRLASRSDYPRAPLLPGHARTSTHSQRPDPTWARALLTTCPCYARRSG